MRSVITSLVVAVVWSHAEATDCTKTHDLLENCAQWTACVTSAGVGCYNPTVFSGHTL